MNGIRNLVAVALAGAGLAIAGPAAAQHHGGRGGGHWSGGHGGNWSGGHFDHGRHFRGWGGWSFSFGVPIFWPGYYYGGYPYYYYPAYPYPYPYAYSYAAPAYPESAWAAPSDEDLGPTTEVTPGPGAPTEGPLYMNYCASSKAYYPKVTQCPEGWRFIAPTR